MPRRTISGSTSAQLPSRPTEIALRCRQAFWINSSASSSAVGAAVEVAGLQAALDSARVAFDGEHRGAGHGGGQGLRAAHAAQSAGEDPAAGQIAAEVFLARLDEGLVGALDDALRADVDPGAGGHLAVHHQSAAVEFVKMFPVGPMRDDVRVGDQHAGRVRVGFEHADRLARLHQQRFVVLQAAEGLDDFVEALPIAGGPAHAAVDDQFGGPLGDFRVEIVHYHPQRSFGEPALGGQFRAPRGADFSGGIVAWCCGHGQLCGGSENVE